MEFGLELAAGVSDNGRETTHELGSLLSLDDAVTRLERVDGGFHDPLDPSRGILESLFPASLLASTKEKTTQVNHSSGAQTYSKTIIESEN